MTTAIITLVRNEKFFLPHWIEYYSRVPGAQLVVLDHESDDGSTAGIDSLRVVHGMVHHPEMENASWMLHTVQHHMGGLLRSGYERVIYAEVDEFLIPDPERWVDLREYLEFTEDSGIVAARGWNVIHKPGDVPLPESGSLLMGRSWKRSELYDIRMGGSKVPDWKIGRHGLKDAPNDPDTDLRLVHLHYANRELGWERIQARMRGKPIAQDGCGFQNKPRDRTEFDSHWDQMCEDGEPIPECYWDRL